jgi:hypothetical protein
LYIVLIAQTRNYPLRPTLLYQVVTHHSAPNFIAFIEIKHLVQHSNTEAKFGLQTTMPEEPTYQAAQKYHITASAPCPISDRSHSPEMGLSFILSTHPAIIKHLYYVVIPQTAISFNRAAIATFSSYHFAQLSQ